MGECAAQGRPPGRHLLRRVAVRADAGVGVVRGVGVSAAGAVASGVHALSGTGLWQQRTRRDIRPVSPAINSSAVDGSGTDIGVISTAR